MYSRKRLLYLIFIIKALPVLGMQTQQFGSRKRERARDRLQKMVTHFSAVKKNSIKFPFVSQDSNENDKSSYSGSVFLQSYPRANQGLLLLLSSE